MMDNIVVKTIISIILWPIAFVTFFIVCLILLLLMIIIPPRYLTPVVRVLCFLILLSSGILLKVHGKKNVNKQKSYLWMFNHQSLYDVFIMPAIMPKYAVGVEAAHQFDWPIWGMVAKRWGNIPIDRQNLKEAIKSIDIARDTLEKGTSIIIAPEGTRTLTGKMGPFKKGAFHLALGAKAEILPVGLRGAFDVKKKTDWRIRPGRVRVEIGESIPYEEYKDMSVEELRDFVKDKIQILAGEKE